MAPVVMNCNDFEPLLYPYLDGEFDAVERLEVEQHLSTCGDCSRRVQAERQFQLNVRQAVHGGVVTPAPEHLRRSIRQGLQRHHRRTVIAQWARMGAAAAAVVAVSSAVYVYSRPLARQRYVADAAAHHAKRFPLEIQHPSVAQLEAWFGGKLDHHVRIPRFPNATPAGARLLNVQEKQAAYISYDSTNAEGRAPRRIGLFVYDDSRREVSFTDNPEVGTSHGFNVVSWRNGDVVYQLVSDLDEADIQKMIAERGSHLSLPATTPATQLPLRPANFQP